MKTLSPYWALFVRAQAAADRSHLSARAWAAEEAADEALEMITATVPMPLPVIAAKLDTLAGNRAAKHRRRGRLRHDLLAPEAEDLHSPSPHDAAFARLELGRIRTQVSDKDWRMLVMAAEGETRDDIALDLGLKASTVKSRVSLLRRRLAH